MNFLQKELFLLSKCSKSINKEELFQNIQNTEIYKNIQSMLDYEKSSGLNIYEMTTYGCTVCNSNYIQDTPPYSNFDDIWNLISSYGSIKQISDSYYFIYDYPQNQCIIIHIYPLSSLHVYDWDTYIYNIDIKFSVYLIPNNRTARRYFTHLDLKPIFYDLVIHIINATFPHKMAIKIQTKCQDWLWKPICNDGKPGINIQLGWKHINNAQN